MLGVATTLVIGGGGFTTITLNAHVFVLPELSTATQETMFVPTGNKEPEAGVQNGLRFPSQLSAALTLKLTATAAPAVVFDTIMSLGQVMTGNCVSLTMTRNEQDPVLPAASVAEHVTMFVPFGKTEPEGGTQVTLPTGLVSVAVAL